jgi:hypothetical protein
MLLFLTGVVCGAIACPLILLSLGFAILGPHERISSEEVTRPIRHNGKYRLDP